MEKKWILKEGADQEVVRQLASELGVDPVLAELLVQRGVRTFAQARSFFRPDLADLYDPFLMKDMDKAVERLHKAVASGEKILVYGDYDVDGTTAVSLVYSFLLRLTDEVDFYIPEEELAIQVSYSIDKSDVTLNREVDALLGLADQLLDVLSDDGLSCLSLRMLIV